MYNQLPTLETLRKLFNYDSDTGKLYWKPRTPDMFDNRKNYAESSCKSWNTRYAGKEAFTAKKEAYDGYYVGAIFDILYLAHRIVWALHYEKRPDLSLDIDHINGVKTDNRINNLRLVTREINSKNASMQCNNTSGFNGVYWQKSTKKWHSQIKADGKRIHLGLFANKDDAIAARIRANIKYGFSERHGEQRK